MLLLSDCLRLFNKCVGVGFSVGRLPVLSYWRVLVDACLYGVSVEAVSGGFLPSADCVLGYVGAVDWRVVEDGFRRVIERAVSVAKREGWFSRPVLVAVDFHDDLYYGGECFGVVGCKSQRGTNRCFRVATLDVCEAGRRFTIAIMPVFKGTSKTDVLEYLVREARKHVKIKCVLLDRGFFSIRVFQRLQTLKLRYIVCAKKSRKLLKAVDDKKHVKYTLMNAHESITVELTVYRPDEKTTWVYATNLHNRPETIAFTYKRRWGIETGYRCKNKYTANTTTRNYTIRLFLLLLAATLFNLWVLTNLVADSATIRKLTRKSKYSTKVTIFQFKQDFIRHLADNG